MLATLAASWYAESDRMGIDTTARYYLAEGEGGCTKSQIGSCHPLNCMNLIVETVTFNAKDIKVWIEGSDNRGKLLLVLFHFLSKLILGVAA